jgi:hypothetical protein
VGSFKAARLTNNDLLSSFDNALGELERQIAATFGFTLDENITASPITFNNSGTVTSQTLKHFANSTSIDYIITDTGGGVSYAPRFVNLPIDGRPFVLLGTNSVIGLGMYMDDGALNGTGCTTQNGVNKVLIPQSTGLATTFYNAQGDFAVPGVIPYAGCKLLPTATDVAILATGTQAWTESVDVGGYFTGGSPTVITIPTGGDGKYLVDVSLAASPFFTVTFVDISATLLLNGVTPFGFTRAFTNAPTASTAHHARIITTVDLVATDTVRLDVTNFCDAVTTFGSDPNSGNETPAFTGSMSLFRIG